MRTSHAPPPLGPPNERLRQARQAAGFESAAAASTRFGWSENTYKSHENGMRGIRADVAEKYARAFQVSREWLLFGSDPGVPEATSLGGPSDIGPEIIPAQELVGTVADLPVYASAEGGADGEMIVETSPIEFVKRPEPLLTVRGGFAVYITGESMEPAYFRGD
ncbi:MAG: helix-turn-helix domain-containing protein, partial [Rhodospirillaceae bacterium]